MSDDVNKDIERAVQASKPNSGQNNTNNVVIPPPRTLQHGLNQAGGVTLSNPKTCIAEIQNGED